MINLHSDGNTIKVVNDTGIDIKAGDIGFVNDIVYVAAVDIDFDESGTGCITKSYALPAKNTEIWEQGVKIYYDAAAKKCTIDDDTGANKRVGTALVAKLETAVTGYVLLVQT